MKVTVKVILKSRVRVIRVLALITLTLSVGACKDRCEKAKEDALLRDRNPKLYGLWINSAVYQKSNQALIDSGYVSFVQNGEYAIGRSRWELEHSKNEIWSSSDAFITSTGCSQNFPTTDSSLKYEFKNDTLYLFHYSIISYPETGGYSCDGIKMIKVK